MKRSCFLLLPLLLAVLLAGACGSSKTTTPDVSAGADLYQEKCSVCHGAERGGGIGPRLVVHGLTDGQIETVIREGRAAMPSWLGSLTGEEIDNLVAYLSED